MLLERWIANFDKVRYCSYPDPATEREGASLVARVTRSDHEFEPYQSRDTR